VKILLDENLDHRLRGYLGSHEVFTASFKGWDGLKNGKLLDAAESEGFEVLLTGDQSLHYEQNLTGRRLAVISTSSVEWRIVKNHLPKILKAVDSAVPGSFQAVDCGTFSRKRTPQEAVSCGQDFIAHKMEAFALSQSRFQPLRSPPFSRCGDRKGWGHSADGLGSVGRSSVLLRGETVVCSLDYWLRWGWW